MMHGTRNGYITHKCRCDKCRAVEYAYQHDRYARLPKKKISAERTRLRILFLQERGIGAVAISDSCGVGPATVVKIRQGKNTMIYARTEERILSVTTDGIADRAIVDGRRSAMLIERLRNEGWKAKDLARMMGTRQLHPPKEKITAFRRLRIEKLYRRAMNEGQTHVQST